MVKNHYHALTVLLHYYNATVSSHRSVFAEVMLATHSCTAQCRPIMAI